MTSVTVWLPGSRTAATRVTNRSAIPVCVILSLVIERVAYRPLRNAPRLAPLITAIGVSIVIQTVAMLVWGRTYMTFPQLIPDAPIELAGATVTLTYRAPAWSSRGSSRRASSRRCRSQSRWSSARGRACTAGPIISHA